MSQHVHHMPIDYPQRLKSISDLSDDHIDRLFDLAKHIHHGVDRDRLTEVARGQVLGLLFFEPSTRTQFSFSSAMHRLGGGVIGFSDPASTSISKGETLADTIAIVSGYSDILVARHHTAGAMDEIMDATTLPSINGGDGDGEHPTQALYDLLTIEAEFGRRDVTIALYGDLRYGRTNHSLVMLASRYGARIYCVSPRGLELPHKYLETAREAGAKVETVEDLTRVVGDVDVLYVTRLQSERIGDATRPVSQIEPVKLNVVNRLKPTAIVMHPLPRTSELSSCVDANIRARYFSQAKYGLALRTALLADMLGRTTELRRAFV